jgi:hypothetical protein
MHDARLDECCLWDGGAAMFRRTSEKKTRYQGGQKGGCQKSRGVDREGRRRFARMLRSTRLLHIDEEVALQNVFPFFVLLGLLVRLVL